MAIEYTLYLATDLTPAQLDATACTGQELFRAFRAPDDRARQYVLEDFAFHAKVRIYFRLDKFDLERAQDSLIRCVSELLAIDGSDALLLSNGELPVLQRKAGDLVLRGGFGVWTPARLRLLEGPYRIEPTQEAAVVARWLDAGVAEPPASLEEIAETQLRLGVSLPPPLVDLYRVANGMLEGGMDDRNFRFWPLREFAFVADVLPVPGPGIHDGYVVFADWSLWCHGYAIRLDGGIRHGSIALIDGMSPAEVADTFEAFLALYLADDDRLYGVGGDQA